ncbi:mediator complex subunit Med5-domain-containing protein [Phellopilus nigrolimitatus]|nr:mediator complex subunit Med5-domain-containing protein [Phellopilus nigrolimitatus]
MSLAEVTSRCFQNGISVQKWAGMCHLLKNKNTLMSDFDFQCELSNSILTLFGLYPADLLLYSYITYALHNHDLLSLPIFVSTFVEAAKSPNLHDSSTLDMLCRLVQEEHFSSGLPPDQSLLSFHDTLAPRTLEIVHGGLALLRVSYTLPSSPFHNLTSSASQLVILLLSCIGDMSSVSTAQAMMHYAEVLEMLQTLQLNGEIRTVLETFALSLSMILGDDAKMAQEAQLMQTLQLSLGKGDILGPNSHSDIVTCSLLLRHLMENRTTMSGSGNTPVAIASLVSAFRWTSWSPRVFYTQLFQAALSILAQNSSNHNSALVWRSFVVTRLPNLLSEFEQVLSSEPMADSDWRGATQAAMVGIQHRTDLLAQCDAGATLKSMDDMNVDSSDAGSGRVSSTSPPFFRTLLQYYVHRTNLIDRNTAILINPTVEAAMSTLLGTDSQDSGLSLDAYIESRLAVEANSEEQLQTFLQRAFEDVSNHPLISTIIQRRFENLCQQHDVEGLGILCMAFNSHELALDIISLHVKITNIFAHILAFVEEFDCESVGDPQSAVGHFGNVVLFLQAALVKYQLSSHTFALGERTLSTEYLLSTSIVYRMSQLQYNGEELVAMAAWPKALFDTNSEGIEDNILRTTKPKTLMKIAATFILQASNACADRRMDTENLNNGVSYFTGPLLNWTLVGVIKALLRDIFEKDFKAPVHIDVLQTLVQSSSCPQTVLRLTAHGIISLVTDPKALAFEKSNHNSLFKSAVLRTIANQALGISKDDSLDTGTKPLSLTSQALWCDQPRNAIRNAIAASRAGKAPAFDIGRCVVVAGPTRFLRLLWDELDAAAQIGDMELSRRLASYALLCPPAAVGAGAGRVPPLLPIFFGGMLHVLLARLDAQTPTEQTFGIELLVAVVTSALTGLLQIEWALRAVAADVQTERHFGQPSVTVARRLAADLKRSTSPTAVVVMQRLSSSPSFVANFPMMAA